MKNLMRVRTLAVITMAGALVLVPTIAFAHVATTVGSLEFESGFGSEPAYTDQLNSVVFILTDHGKPVLDLGDAIKVTVSFGDQTTDPMTLDPAFAAEDGEIEGNPGEYHAWFVPTQAGAYTFHFTGTYDGTKVDETLTSGPKTFDEVQAISSATFPAVDAPSNEELATKIDQEVTRTNDAIVVAQASAAAADDAASTAKTIGLFGVLLGAIGLIAAIGALATRKRA
jgi:hypothetical protein